MILPAVLRIMPAFSRRPGDGNGLTMKQYGLSMKIALATIAVMLAAATDAYAYIDPGTGSYILQIVLASLLGAAFAIKLYWNRLKSLFARGLSKRNSKKETDPAGDDE